MKCTVGILVTPVAVKQRLSVRIVSNSFVKGVKYQRIVIAITNNKGYDPSIIQIQNSAQIDLVNLDPLIISLVCLMIGLFKTALSG